MADLERKSFPLGWMPDADALNGPDGCLLRMDNLTLDEVGVLSLRPGSFKINDTTLLDVNGSQDVHSLFAVTLNNDFFLYAGVGRSVFRGNPATPNGARMEQVFDGTGDISFGSHMGQVFMAQGTTRYKDDTITPRPWGISMTGGVPAATGVIGPDTKTFASWALGETLHSVEEDDGNGVDYAEDQDGVADQAISVFTNRITGRAIVTRKMNTDIDFNTLTAGREGEDRDVISFWLYMANEFSIRRITLVIDVNGGTFDKDTYSRFWNVTDGVVTDPDVSANPPGPDPLI